MDSGDAAPPKFSKPISIKEDWRCYDLEHFLIPKHYKKCVDKVMIPHGMVQDRLHRMAYDFYHSIEDRSKPILALCVLKGASQFFNDFVTQLKQIASRDEHRPPQIHIDFVRLKSYEGTESTGKVQLVGMTDISDITDKNLLIVEDIIDTGRTMKKLLATVNEYKPASTAVCTLFLKETEKAIPDRPVPELAGFTIPDEFIVGYCMDYNENFRDLDHVCVISKFGFDLFKQDK
jgi:hypoxanthine phosphoribosyltransferase